MRPGGPTIGRSLKKSLTKKQVTGNLPGMSKDLIHGRETGWIFEPI